MKLNQITVALALGVSALAASASTTNWGPHDPTEFGFGFGSVFASTSVVDTFSFTLTAPASLVFTAVTNDFPPGLDLTGSTLTLYAGPVGFGTFVAGLAFDSTQVQSFSGAVAAGNYYFEVLSSVAPNATAGSYTFTSEVSPVPEPEVYALMVAGLLGVGLLALRRRPQR
jgi:hypothetical protein